MDSLIEEIVADNGPQFVTGEMKDFLKANGVCLCLSSPYHPASNGQAERAVRTFKEDMKVILSYRNSTNVYKIKTNQWKISLQIFIVWLIAVNMDL